MGALADALRRAMPRTHTQGSPQSLPWPANSGETGPRLISETVAGRLICATPARLKEEGVQDRLEEGLDPVELAAVQLDSTSCASLLRYCGNAKALSDGKCVHADIIRGGYDRGRFVGNLLVQMYGKCGCPDDARVVFDRIYQRNVFSGNLMIQAYVQNGRMEDARYVFETMPQRNVVSWNAMIAAYSQDGRGREALELFGQMLLKGVAPNKVTFISVLDACASLAALEEGKKNHVRIRDAGLESDVVVGTALICMYGKCGNLDDARDVFDKMAQRDVVSWNAMITAYSQNGQGKEALELFGQMQLKSVEPNKITFITILDACAGLTALQEGKESHASIIDSGYEMDVVVGTALVNMYGKCGSLGFARNVFDKMPQQDVISFNAIIAAYSQNGHGKEALKLFQQMQLKGTDPNKVTFICILDACADLINLLAGKECHSSIVGGGFDVDIGVGTALVNMYGKCGSIDDARWVFDKMPQRNVVSWTAMIAAYSRNGHGKDALKIFRQMQLKGIAPDKITFIIIIDACSVLAAMAEGKESHSSIVHSGFESDVLVSSALVHMYGKCGTLDDARHVFEKMLTRNVISWNAMVTAYSHNGHAKEAIKLFQQMQLNGVLPDKITFTSILSGCSHSGLLDDGWHYFSCMNKDYSIAPTVEHFVCMIDLLGRAGQLNEAEELLNSMPFGPDSVAWTSLLGSCKIHGDIERGKHAVEHILELDPKNDAPFVLLSNIYSAAGKVNDAAKLRKAMKYRDVKKKPGYSCVEVNNRVHEFTVGDMSHPQIGCIYAELQRLHREMEIAGYIPDGQAEVYDVEEMNKEHIVCYHSERLAVAFGLISTLPGTPLYITKNLRVCSDCHAATKLVSKIVQRKVIVRDVNRFHHFEHGVCSCRDYW